MQFEAGNVWLFTVYKYSTADSDTFAGLQILYRTLQQELVSGKSGVVMETCSGRYHLTAVHEKQGKVPILGGTKNWSSNANKVTRVLL